MAMKVRIRLKAVHDARGETAYRVAKNTGLTGNTVRRYTEAEDVVVDYIHSSVIVLANYYGVDWRDPQYVKWIADDEEGDTSPERRTSLPATA